MDIINVIETLGIPVAVAGVLGYFCWFLVKFITGKLTSEITERHERLEKMQIGLIDSNNKFRQAIIKNNAEVLSQCTNIYSQLVTLIDIMTKLMKNGNGNNCSNYKKRNK
jgi:hypothetical protein